ncbi:MAG: hypothetical protein Q9172_001676 [Xanthocarpia lactea]
MSTSASAHPPTAGDPPVPSPVLRLADHLRSVSGSQSTISFPQPLLQMSRQFLNQRPQPRIPENEITTLVEALDADGSNNCCRLDGMALQTTYAFLRISEPCLAYRRGHCLFVESLHPSHATTQAQMASQRAKKTALGENILARSIIAFLDRERSPRARRWIGSLALELLRDCRENKDVLLKDLGQASQGLGETIVHGNDEILKLIAGTIIRELIDNGSSSSAFFPADLGGNFPEMAEQASQWTTDFIEFVDGLETQGLLTQERRPSTFAYAVFADGTTYNTETGLSILVTVADGLTIMVPSTESDTAKYIDIPFENISNAEIELGGPGSQSRPKQPAQAAVLILHLSESAGAAYYINETKRPACRINLAFDTVRDANITEDRIKTMSLHHELSIQPTRQYEIDASLTNEHTYSVELISQSAIDLSKQPAPQNNTFSALKPLGLRALQATNLSATAAQAHQLFGISTKLNSAVTGGSTDDFVKDPADLAARSQVMVGRESINVSQDAVQYLNFTPGRISPGSSLNARRRSSSVWRDGLNAIENSPDLQPDLKYIPKVLDDHGFKAEDAPEATSYSDDDLYTATPRASKTQLVKDTATEAHQKSTNGVIQSIEDQQGPKPAVRKKLSRSMRVSEGEPLSTFPSAGSIRGLDQSKSTVAKQSSSTAIHSKGTKRKATEKQARGPNKKAKLGGLAAKKSLLKSTVPDLGEAPTGGGIFDLPTTPPSGQRANLKSQKPIESKSKVSKNSRITPTAKTSKVSLKTARIAKAASKPKPSSKRKLQEELETEELENHEDSLNPVHKSDGNAKTDERGANIQPKIKQPRKAESQTKLMNKTGVPGQSPEVKNESTSNNKPKPNGPAHISRGTRAAARKANQKMREIASTESEDESPFDEPQSIGQGEVAEERMAAIPDNEHHFANAHDASGDVAATISKPGEATEVDTHGEVPSMIQSVAPGGPNSVLDNSEHQSQLPVKRLAHTTPITLVADGESHQESLPIVMDIPPAQEADILDRSAAQAEAGKGDRVQNEKGIEKDNNITPGSGDVLRKELHHGGVSPKDTTTSLVAGRENGREIGHLVERRDVVDSDDRNGDLLTVPQGLDDDIIAPIMEEDQTLPAAVAETAINPQSVWKTGRNTIAGDRDGPQREGPADSPCATVSKDRGKGSSACSPTASRDHESNIPNERTTSTHLASKLYSTLSGVLNLDDQVRHLTNAGRVVHEPAIQQSSAAKAHTGNKKLTSRQDGGIADRDAGKQSLRNSPMRLVTTGHQQQLPNIPEVTNTTPHIKAASKTKFQAEPSAIPNPGPYIISSGPSSESELIDLPTSAAPKTSLHPSNPVLAEQYGIRAPKRNTTPAASAFLALQRPTSSGKTSKKRPSEAEQRDLSKKTKLRSPGALEHATDPVGKDTGVYKDPSRLPQVISFGTRGPRNQGLSSSKRDIKLRDGAYGSQGQSQQRRQNMQIDVKNDVGRGPAPVQDGQRFKQGPSEGSIHLSPSKEPSQRLQKHLAPKRPQPQIANRSLHAIQQPRGQARSTFPAHSSIFGDDSTQHILSQRSRVKENGSPLPSQRSRTYRSPPTNYTYMHEGSDSENVVPPLIDDETTLVHTEANDDYELGLPIFHASHRRRKSDVEVVQSSKSKHGPSSPTAPSTVLTDVQAHKVQPGGRLVNIRTNAVLVPETPPDPFTSLKSQRPNGFLDKLRRAKSGATPTKVMVNKLNDRPRFKAVDPDTTLVEADDIRYQPRRWRRAAAVSSSTSSTNTTMQGSQSSQDSDQQSAARKRWRDALEPYQQDTLSVLYEVSHELMGHLIDTETAINDIVNDYQRRGSRFNEHLADDLERKLGQYIDAANEQRAGTVERTQKLNSLVTKNLKRKPVAEDLARRMEETERIFDAQMEEALRMCDEVIR